MFGSSQQKTNDEILQILSLSANKKELFRHRYLVLLNQYECRAKRYSRTFHSLRVIVGIGSLFVPALLSIQQVNGGPDNKSDMSKNLDILLYWATWILSLMVTMSNGMFTLFKVDKKYYFMHTLMEQLRSEGWQFMTLTGRYGVYRKPGPPGGDMSGVNVHDAAFGLFCHMVEKIKMHQVEEEYYKLTDDYTKQDKVTGPTPVPTQKAWGDTDAAINIPGRAPSPAPITGGMSAMQQGPRMNTDMSILPRTPQNNLNWDALPLDVQALLQNIIPGAVKPAPVKLADVKLADVKVTDVSGN